MGGHGGSSGLKPTFETMKSVEDVYAVIGKKSVSKTTLDIYMAKMEENKAKANSAAGSTSGNKPTDEELKKAVEMTNKAMGLDTERTTKAKRERREVFDGSKQPKSGEGVPSYYNTKTQKGHPQSFHPVDLAKRLGLHTSEEAKEFANALYEPSIGGFTRGWDAVIRAYQRGATKEQIKAMDKTMDAIKHNFKGDENAYFAALKKKASLCEELIDRSPKWNGKELYRGIKNLDAATLKRLTDTSPDTLINLNAGTASWSTSKGVAMNFASGGFGGRLVANVTGQRRGTSIKNGSYFKGEDEVLCSRREAFRCTKVENVGGVTHAWYEVVDTDYDWS